MIIIIYSLYKDNRNTCMHVPKNPKMMLKVKEMKVLTNYFQTLEFLLLFIVLGKYIYIF